MSKDIKTWQERIRERFDGTANEIIQIGFRGNAIRKAVQAEIDELRAALAASEAEKKRIARILKHGSSASTSTRTSVTPPGSRDERILYRATSIKLHMTDRQDIDTAMENEKDES